ncbi:hypothetical protein JAAARDRAFT_197149 [Jaapia argillacea MUCL 33604]|uniref:DUF4219 domain-containing protein n=1 Tax=Jaapia argillacea MUCL 33604 TaxID=933084 RepID=A0A067PTM1_9AGAM|nr:hypothetical protein JAAARDRAFT_197149 [Jaapia argillacea MUCL 33604]
MSSTSSSSSPIPVSSITKLDGTNYTTWAVAACTYLMLNKLWPYVINHDLVKLTSTFTQADRDAFAEVDGRALSTLAILLHESLYYLVDYDQPSHKLWTTLLTLFHKGSALQIFLKF